MVLSLHVLDAFEKLGVSPDTPQDLARSTYKKLALSHHPDRNHGDPTATQRFQEIGAAWQICQRHYENPSWSHVPDPTAKAKGRSHEPYDGPRYAADDDIPLDEEEAEMFFRFMFEEMMHNRFSYAKGQRYRQQRSGAYGGGMHAFSGGFAESQKRQEENAEKLRNENEAYKQRVRELDAEIAAEQREREQIVRDEIISQERHISAQLRAFHAGKAGDAAGMRGVIQEFNLDVNAPEKLKSKLKHGQKQGEDVKFETMLHVASASCDPDTVLFLINRGANPTALNSSSLTPFQLAILHSNTAVVRLFLERHHANPKAEGYHPSKAARDGRTPLQIALASGKPDIGVIRLLIKEATVHDVVRCWEQAEMMMRSAKEGSVEGNGVKWQEIRDVLLTKKGFSPSSEDSTRSMSKKDIKAREAEEKARRRAEDEDRAAENLRKKRERAEMREREEEVRRKQEEKKQQEAENLRKEQERRRKELEEEQKRKEDEKARRRKEMEEREVHRLAKMERVREAKEVEAERLRQAEQENRRQAEIAHREIEAEKERQRRATVEARRNQKEVAATRRIEREERMRAEQEQRNREEAERRKKSEREERFKAEQQERVRVSLEMQESTVRQTRREAELELERPRQDEETRRAASAKAREEAKMRRRAEQSARDKARNQRIREEKERDSVKAPNISRSQSNGTLSPSKHISFGPRRHLPGQSPAAAYPTPSSSFSHSAPSPPPPNQLRTPQKTPVARPRLDSRFALPSLSTTVDIQSCAIPDDLFRYEPPVSVTANPVSSVSALHERAAELHPNPTRGRREGWRGGRGGRGGRGRGERGGRGRGRGRGIDSRGVASGGRGRGRERGGGGRVALEAEVAQKDFELQQLRAQLVAAESGMS